MRLANNYYLGVGKYLEGDSCGPFENIVIALAWID
jgi:hypothetical protein